MTTRLRAPRPSAGCSHARVWRIVAGAVVDALQSHPEYLTDKGADRAVGSITKRVVGQLVGHAAEARKRGGTSPYVGGSDCHRAPPQPAQGTAPRAGASRAKTGKPRPGGAKAPRPPFIEQETDMPDFQKNQRGEVVRVVREEFKGTDLVNIRVWFTGEDGQLRPSKTGLTINGNQIDLLISALEQVRDEGAYL